MTGIAKFLVKNDAGATVYTASEIALSTAVVTPGTAATAARMNNIEGMLDTLDDAIDVVYTTGGTSTAFTITTPQASALVTDERWRVKFNATAGAAPTLNRDTKGAKPLKYLNSAGVLTACGATTLISGMRSDVVYDGTNYVVIDSLPPAVASVPTFASAAEINTGTEAAKTIAPDQLQLSNRNIRYFYRQLIDPGSPCSAGAIAAQTHLEIAGTIIDCGFWHDVFAGCTGNEVIDCHLDGTTIMATNKMTGAAGYATNEEGGATQPAITNGAYAINQTLTWEIDTAHTGTVPLGLTVWLAIRPT